MKIAVEPAGPIFTAYIEGQPPTPFVRLPGDPGTATFENKAHDFPQRVIYRRCDPDLCARTEGVVDGKLQGQDWRYRRIGPSVDADRQTVAALDTAYQAAVKRNDAPPADPQNQNRPR